MRVAVQYENERVELDVPEGNLVGAWSGPDGLGAADLRARVANVLEHPTNFPPLRSAVVPGDQVAIACGADFPEAEIILQGLCDVLETAGVERESISVVVEAGARDDFAEAVPKGASFVRHDPDDSKQLAYLASTKEGRRIYLNRRLIDADFVVPVGRVGFDVSLGYQGPWSVVFPGLSNTATQREFRAAMSGAVPDRDRPRPLLLESTEVGWLLGTLFQVGLVGGVEGLKGVVAGHGPTVFHEGIDALESGWTIRAETRAELVVVGVGRPGVETGVEAVARGLATAKQLVRRGGKIVVMSRARGALGPGMQRLLGVDEPQRQLAALKGHESDSDYPVARQWADALAWADVYLLSKLGTETVEDLAAIALERPEEANRLVKTCGACWIVNQADQVCVQEVEESK